MGVKVWGDGGRLQEPRSMAGPGSCVPLLHSLHAPNSTQKHPEIGQHLAFTLSMSLVIVLLSLYQCVWSSSAKARPLHDLYHGMLLKSPVLTQKRGQCATRICSRDKPLRVRRIQDHLGDGCARIPFLFFFIVKSHEVVFGELCRTPTIGYCARFYICFRDVIISSYSCRIYGTR